MELDEQIIVKSSRLKSVVWNDFDRIKRGDTLAAVCKNCKKNLSGSSSSGTSHLRNHLLRCRRRSNHDIAQLLAAREKNKERSLVLANVNSSLQNTANGKCERKQPKDETINNGNIYFDKKQSEVDLARMIILHGYPLAMVEHAGFQTFVKNVQPLFEFMTISRIEAVCKELFEQEKQIVYELLDKLSGKVSLGFDTWTASNGTEYLCLTAYYIDETWQLQKKILNFIMIVPYYTDQLLSDVIMTCLMEWDIDRKLFSLTIDCDSSYDTIVFRIRDRLSQNRFLLCSGQLFDLRCAANVLKLMVLDVLEACAELTHKIRDSIQYVQSSQVMHQNFNEIALQVGVDCQKCLFLDNPFQWDSTYFMFEVALEYRNAFLLLQGHDPVYASCLSDVEWERASNIASYLKLFVEVNNAFTWSNSPTANLYFPEICSIHLQLIEWCKSSDDYIGSLGLKLTSRFNDFWSKCSVALAVAAVLDPRYKMKLIEYYYPQIYSNEAPHHINDVSNSLKILYNEHAICSPLAALDEGLACQVSSTDERNMDYLPSAANDSKDRLMGYDKFLNETVQSVNIKSELDKYLEEPLIPRNVDFGILDWWHAETPRYPILSMMARNILGIPMSKVLLASAFDTSSKVLDQQWSVLGADTLQALICARDWMQNHVVDC